MTRPIRNLVQCILLEDWVIKTNESMFCLAIQSVCNKVHILSGNTYGLGKIMGCSRHILVLFIRIIALCILNVNLTDINRGPWCFKSNNSFILDNEYQMYIRKTITEIATLNENANPNTLWELIKGSFRNETIKYDTKKKKTAKK